MPERDAEGFYLLRDRHGTAWAAFNPDTRVLRHLRRARSPGCPTCEQVADISLDRLVSGEGDPITTHTRPRRSTDQTV